MTLTGCIGTLSSWGFAMAISGAATWRPISKSPVLSIDLAADLEKPGFIDGLKALAQAGLVFESANPDPRLIRAILNVAERVPGLRIVIDHLPQATAPTQQAEREEYWSNLRRLGQSPRVFVKLSEIPIQVNGMLATDPHFYQRTLDALWDVFGEDRIFFGSDWPNSDHVAPYADTLAIVRGYVSQKPPRVEEKFFWKNSIAAYKWHRRRPDQPTLYPAAAFARRDSAVRPSQSPSFKPG